MGQPKYLFIQALRGIAALWVVIYHAHEGGHVGASGAGLPSWALLFFEAGWMGVPIFFALSGFVIAMSVDGAVVTPAFLGKFAARRFIRLDPPYWAAIALTLAFAAISADVKGESYVPPDANAVLAHLFYLQVILGYPSINVIFWTLTFEIQFYLFFVSMMLLRQKMRGSGTWTSDAIVYGVMFAIAFLWSTRLVSFGSGHGFFIDFWGSFFIGALAFHGGRSSFAVAGLVVLGVGMLVMGDAPQQAAAVTGAVLFAALRTGFIVKGLGWRWLQGLGAISYSQYLIHGPVQGAAFFVTTRFLPSSGAGQLISLAVTTGISIIAAICFWQVVERPSHALARRFGSRSRVPRADAVPFSA